MSTKSRQANLTVTENMASEALELTSGASDSVRLVIETPDGSVRALPDDLESLLRNVLLGAARGENLKIGRLSDELTSTDAADSLGISRPTLMKMVERNEIRSYKVGTHTRFRRRDVDRLKQKRLRDREEAFAELRQLDDEFELDG